MIPAEFVLHLEYSGESIEETLSDGEHLTATVTPVKITDASAASHKSSQELTTWDG